MRETSLAAVAALLLVAHATTAAAEPRPRVVLLANTSGTETTDLLTPFAVLRDAGIADVAIAATGPGPVALMPGLTIEPDETVAEVATPPDVVIVPAMHDPTEAPLLATVRAWAAAGSLVVSICDGAWVLAHAGLLDGRSATSHWYSIASLRTRFPGTTWRQDARWVRDGNIITSAGVSASLPLARHLVDLLKHVPGTDDPHALGPPHGGAAFRIQAGDVVAGARNYLLPWRWDTVAVPISDGVDELALGITLDLLDRTYAVHTTTVAPAALVRSRRGLRLVPDVSGRPAGADRTAAVGAADFDAILADIERRYGAATRSFVALQIEYPEGRMHDEPARLPPP